MNEQNIDNAYVKLSAHKDLLMTALELGRRSSTANRLLLAMLINATLSESETIIVQEARAILTEALTLIPKYERLERALKASAVYGLTAKDIILEDNLNGTN